MSKSLRNIRIRSFGIGEQDTNFIVLYLITVWLFYQFQFKPHQHLKSRKGPRQHWSQKTLCCNVKLREKNLSAFYGTWTTIDLTQMWIQGIYNSEYLPFHIHSTPPIAEIICVKNVRANLGRNGLDWQIPNGSHDFFILSAQFLNII